MIEVIGDDARSGRIMLDQDLDIENVAGEVVHCLCFVDAIEIIHPAHAFRNMQANMR